MNIRYCLPFLALGLCSPAAAETTLCTEIAALPATITAAGVYCLKQDLATAITSGNAIDIQSQNVTLDCNGHRIGGLQAGADTVAVGVNASNRTNVLVRDCSVRGFRLGIVLSGLDGAAYTVENNRLDANTQTGIVVQGEGSIVRNNRVLDTGGNSAGLAPSGIYLAGSGDVLDNHIEGVYVTGGFPGSPAGIKGASSASTPFDGRIQGNHVGGLLLSGQGVAYGIGLFTSARVAIRDNTLRHSGGPSIAIRCHDDKAVASGNTMLQFGIALSACTDGHDNEAP